MDHFSVGFMAGLAFAAGLMGGWFLLAIFAPPPTWNDDEITASAGTGLIFTVVFTFVAIIAGVMSVVS